MSAVLPPEPTLPAASDAPVKSAPVLLAVAVGGVLGAEGRYAVGRAVPHAPAGIPWSTIIINTTGCLLIGVLMVCLLEVAAKPGRLVRPFLGVGILGGYTTFSSFSVDVERLIANDQLLRAGIYLAVTVVGCALAVELGMWLTRRAARTTIAARIAEKPAAENPAVDGSVQ